MPIKSDDKFIKPVYLKKLAEKMAAQPNVDTAAMLGISATHFANCVAEKSPTTLTIELAAQQVYEKTCGGGAKDQVVLVASVPSALAEMIETIIRAHNCKYQIIK